MTQGVDELRSEAWQIMQFSNVCEFDSDYDELLDKLIAAVREDERQKMYDLWKGMLP